MTTKVEAKNFQEQAKQPDFGNYAYAFFQEKVKEWQAALESEGVFLMLYSKSANYCPIQLCQLGLGMFMDKTVLLLAEEGATIPKNLVKVAQAVETYTSKDDIHVKAGELLESVGIVTKKEVENAIRKQ